MLTTEQESMGAEIVELAGPNRELATGSLRKVLVGLLVLTVVTGGARGIGKGSAEAFAAAVVRLFEDRPLCERLRRRAWERMKARFGPDSARQRLDDLDVEVGEDPPHVRGKACRVDAAGSLSAMARFISSRL